MLEPDCRDAIGRQVRIPQIIVAAQAASVLAFLVFMVVLAHQGGEGDGDGQPILTYLAIVFAGLAVLAWLIVPNVMAARARQRIIDGTWQLSQSSQNSQNPGGGYQKFIEKCGDAGKLYCTYLPKTILAVAMLECAGFMASISYLLEARPMAAAIAVIMIVAVAAHFPTRSGVIHWIEGQLRIIDEQRRLGQ